MLPIPARDRLIVVTGLSGSGLIVVNPPFTLKDELGRLLPFLKERLRQDRFASSRCFWIAGENQAAS